MSDLCPWWLAYTFDNRLRRLFQDPWRILPPYVHEGMTVADIGPGMGYFAIPMASMVGDGGLVIAADLQPQMLRVLAKRARRAGVAGRIRLHQCQPDRVGVEGPLDFVLMANVVHETPDPSALLREVQRMLRPGGKCLIIEPPGHVSAADFAETLRRAAEAGLVPAEEPRVRAARTALLSRPQ